MRPHLFIALLIATFFYLITVLAGLLLKAELNIILARALIVLIFFFLSSYLIFLIMEKLAEDKLKEVRQESKDKNKESKKSQGETNKQEEKLEEKDKGSDFTPLSPPVLELAKNEEVEI